MKMTSYLKIVPYKKTIILFLLVFLSFIYWNTIKIYFTFDTTASDLAEFGGEYVKSQLLSTSISYDNALFEYNFYQSFGFPILISFTGYSYALLKSNYLKFYIGKNNLYAKNLLKLKIYSSLTVVLFFSMIYIIIIFIAVFGGVFHSKILENDFARDSFLTIFSSSIGSYAIFYWLVKMIALVLNSMLVYYCIDYFKRFSRGILTYLGFLWILSPLMYMFVNNQYIVPMTSLMVTSYTELTVPQIILTYLPYLLFFVILWRTTDGEVC